MGDREKAAWVSGGMFSPISISTLYLVLILDPISRGLRLVPHTGHWSSTTQVEILDPMSRGLRPFRWKCPVGTLRGRNTRPDE